MIDQKFRGLGVCAGMGFGKVHRVDRRRLAIPRYHIPQENRAREVDRFERAVSASEWQIGALQERAREASGLSQAETLLQVHAVLLRDSALHDATCERITRDGQNAEWALKDTLRHIKGLFDRLDEDYFRERRSDVDVVGDRILRNLVGAEVELLEHLSEDAVVVAYDLAPGDTVALARFAARAFVTETGGRTSHTAILAQALNVPCVLNVRGIMDLAGSGDDIIVDGQAGEIILRPSPEVMGRYRGMARRRNEEELALLAERDLPADTLDGTHVELLGNIEVSQELDNVISLGGEGIGLYRTEFLYVERPELAGAQAHYEAYAKLVRAMNGRPLTIRTVDIGGDKFIRHAQNQSTDIYSSSRSRPSKPRSQNPALGLRAIRLSLKDERGFREQLEGILLASAEGPVRLLLPFLTQLDELRQAKAIIEAVKEDLTRRRRPFDPNLPIGVMIETPAAAWMSDIFAQEADFFSIGTNDLIQYSLATDRGDEEVAYLFKPCHPAILRTLAMVAQAGLRGGRSVSVCGEMAADPLHLPVLLGIGLRCFSMTARAIPSIKRLVRRLDLARCEALAQQVLKMATATEVEACLKTHLAEWTPELYGAPA